MGARATKLKILIADDHAGTRQVIRRACAEVGGEFIECRNGEEAVAAFGASAPDWIIMDVQMPGMDGLKATAAIRRLDAGARVIVVSQHGDAGYEEQARLAGAVGFVGKEDMSRLVEIIRGGPRVQP